MSKFLSDFKELVDAGMHENACESVFNLGKNARRMLEIGIVQDELVTLGFNREDIVCFRKKGIRSIFRNDDVYLYCLHQDLGCQFYYDSPTWQDDLLNKVKELMK